MGKTLHAPKEITPKVREDYLRAMGAHYCRPREGVSYGISSTSKQMKGGDHILKEIYYIEIYGEHGELNMRTKEQDSFPTNQEMELALRENGGYAAKIDKRFKIAE